MTLSTNVRICEPINYQLVFLKGRELIGIPAERQWHSHTRKNGTEWIQSEPGGFAAMLCICSLQRY